MVSIKKKQSKKKGKLSQKQQQTVIVNIDKRRRARNIKQELLKEQQQKLQQLQAISQMKTPEFQELNIKLKDLEKEKEDLKKKEEEDKKQQSFIKAQEEQLKKFETDKRQEELKAIQEKLKSLTQQFDKKPEPKALGEKEETKVLGEMEEEPKEKKKESFITIPPNKRVNIKPIFKKKEEATREATREAEEESKEGEIMPISTPIEAKPIKQLGRPKGSYNLTLQEYNYYIQNTPIDQVPRNLRKYSGKQYESIAEIPTPIKTYVRKKLMEGKAKL